MKLLSVLLLLFTLILPAAAQNSRDTVHKSMHPVFVATFEERGYCTAYAVGPRTISIAQHCVGEDPKPSTVLFIMDGQYSTNEETILDGNDHALVVLKDIGLGGEFEFKGFGTWIHDAFPAYTPQQGERMIFWGAPKSIACTDCYREGYFSGFSDKVGNGYILMWFAMLGAPGDSGSLIFTTDGRVVGEVSIGMQGFIGASGFAFTPEQVAQIK